MSNGQNWGVNYVHTFGSTATLQVGCRHVWQNYKTDTAIANRSSTFIADVGYDNDFGCNFIGPRACQTSNHRNPRLFERRRKLCQVNQGSNIYEYKADSPSCLAGT